jgi:hypothetical protein
LSLGTLHRVPRLRSLAPEPSGLATGQGHISVGGGPRPEAGPRSLQGVVGESQALLTNLECRECPGEVPVSHLHVQQYLIHVSFGRRHPFESVGLQGETESFAQREDSELPAGHPGELPQGLLQPGDCPVRLDAEQAEVDDLGARRGRLAQPSDLRRHRGELSPRPCDGRFPTERRRPEG